MTGGFPARYGDRMSSVLDMQYREGSRDKIQGKASVNIATVDAVVEGPIGKNATFIVGGRRSYMEYVLRMLNYERTIHPTMYDFQGVIGYTLTPQSKLLFKFIYSGDDFKNDPEVTSDVWLSIENYGTITDYSFFSDSTEEHDHYSSSMFALQSVNILSSSAILKSEISLYDQLDSEHYWEMTQNSEKHTLYDTAAYFSNTGVQYLRQNALRIQTWEFSSNLDLQIAAPYAIKIGGSYQWILYNQDLINENIFKEHTNEENYPDTISRSEVTNQLDSFGGNTHAQTFKTSGYLENIIQIGNQVILNLGGRIDYFDFNRDLTVSPRVNVSYHTENGFTIRGSWGHYYQSPIYNQLAYSIPTDTNTQSQHAIGYVLGMDYDLFFDHQSQHFLKFKMEAYHKKYDTSHQHVCDEWRTGLLFP